MTAHRPSIEERIAWTPGFPSAAAKVVLLALARSADFETGKNAYPSVKTLATRTGLKKRTIERALRDLRKGLWVTARRSHRYPTTYDINLDRLTTHGPGATVIATSRLSVGTLVRLCGGLITRLHSLSAILADRFYARDLSAIFANLSAYLADLPVIRTRKRKSAPARVSVEDQKLPGLIGTARPPPTIAAAPTRGPTRLDGGTSGSGCGHTPRCESFDEHRRRIHADVEAERGQKQGTDG